MAIFRIRQILMLFIFFAYFSSCTSNPEKDSYAFKRNCNESAYSATDSLFEDFDLFAFRPVCPIKNVTPEMQFLIVHASDSVVEIIERYTPKTRISRKFVKTGSIWKYCWIASRLPQRGFEDYFLWIANPKFIAKLQFRNEWVGPVKNWLVWKVQVMLPDYSLCRAYLGRELPITQLKAEWKNICFDKIRFEFEENQIRSYSYNLCNENLSKKVGPTILRDQHNSYQFWLGK